MLRNVCWHKEAPEVYVKEDSGEYLPMPAEFLREAAGLPEEAPVTMPEAAVVPFYAFRVLFSSQVPPAAEDLLEAVPAVGRYGSVPDSEPNEPPPELLRRPRVPLPPDVRDHLPRPSVVGVNQPHFVPLPAYIRPEFVDFKDIVEVPEGLVVVAQPADDLVYHGEADAEHRPDVADCAAPCEHAGDEHGDVLAAAVLLVVAGLEELAAAVLAQIILLAIAFPAVLFYIVSMAMWTGDFYVFRDTYSISLFTLPAYFL